MARQITDLTFADIAPNLRDAMRHMVSVEAYLVNASNAAYNPPAARGVDCEQIDKLQGMAHRLMFGLRELADDLSNMYPVED